MPVWDEENTRDEWHPVPFEEEGTRRKVLTPLAREGAHDGVRTAAQNDAADIVAKARLDIRRIVDEARRELQELTAQVQAADVELADDDLPDASVLEADQIIPATDEEWLAPQPVARIPSMALSQSVNLPAPFVSVEPDYSDEDAVLSNTFAQPLAPASSARTFVVLFALAGLVVVAGTVWWLKRAPATVVSSAPAANLAADSPAALPPAETAAARPPSPPATDAAPPVASARPVGLSVAVEAQRDTWVRWTIDGESDAGHTYRAGEKRQIDGANEVLIRAGDAGGLLISVDGAPATMFGPDGLSLTRRYVRGEKNASPAEPRVPVSTPEPAFTAPPATIPPVTAPPPSVPVAAAPPRPAPVAPAPLVTLPDPAAARAPVRTAAPGRVDITASSRQWLDAYHRQDRVTMETLGAPSLTISDERRPDQRFPFGLEVTRAFEDEQLELSGDSAKFSAKMTERAATGAVVSHVSQTWVRRQGAWQLQEARIVHDSLSPAPPR